MTPLHETPGYDQRPCRGKPVDAFYPERGDMAGLAAALRVCAECPVTMRLACLAYGLEHDEDGVWGGTSARERRRIRERRARGAA